MREQLWLAVTFLFLFFTGALRSEGELPHFDFTQAADQVGWHAVHDQSLESTPAGILAHISGPDPYFQGPARDFPPDRLLWLRLRLKSDQAGTAQVFYFTNAPAERSSVRFEVPAGVWHEAIVPMPPLGPHCRLRIDPPGQTGECVFERLSFEARPLFTAPRWPRPEPPDLGVDPLTVQSGPLKLVQNRTQLGGFELEVAGEKAAIGQTSFLIGYLWNTEPHWFDPQKSGRFGIKLESRDNAFELKWSWSDPDGAHWECTQRVNPANHEGSIDIETSWSVDRDREAFYLPAFLLLPGAGTYGTNKQQGLFAGVEYLANEPSSSEADLIGPAARRLAPNTVKVTFPFMSILAGNHYLGLIWKPQPNLCAVYDSPDRQFHSGGHLFGLLFPGSDGIHRDEGSLLPYRPDILRANEPLRLQATLIGGTGSSLVPAVQHYLRLRGLPPVPPTLGAPQVLSTRRPRLA